MSAAVSFRHGLGTARLHWPSLSPGSLEASSAKLPGILESLSIGGAS